MLPAKAYARKLDRNNEYYHRNRDRILAWQKGYREAHRDQRADNFIKLRYGITFYEFLALAAKTDDHCPVCKDRPATHVDHDHATGKIRGVLCNNCNAGIGILGDSVERLESAKQYLHSFR